LRVYAQSFVIKLIVQKCVVIGHKSWLFEVNKKRAAGKNVWHFANDSRAHWQLFA